MHNFIQFLLFVRRCSNDSSSRDQLFINIIVPYHKIINAPILCLRCRHDCHHKSKVLHCEQNEGRAGGNNLRNM